MTLFCFLSLNAVIHAKLVIKHNNSVLHAGLAKMIQRI